MEFIPNPQQELLSLLVFVILPQVRKVEIKRIISGGKRRLRHVQVRLYYGRLNQITLPGVVYEEAFRIYETVIE